MTDKTDKSEAQRRAMQPSLPSRPSYDRVVEDIDKWTKSSGLQKPK
jgi:hypothetical protein